MHPNRVRTRPSCPPNQVQD
uniref:Uncharacterized protein n=1 Tax=Rhizophora mucronata TaxID=61149 RepID=A0A2P2R1E8_RHIMU